MPVPSRVTFDRPWLRRGGPLAALLAVLVAAGAGVWLPAGADGETTRGHVVADGVSLDVVLPPGDGPRPGVVVAHGFAGSARLMAPFGDSLAARGYAVVLLDFTGHGAHARPLPDSAAGTAASTAALQRDLGVATAQLRALPGVDPARIALVGHSMGASAVTRYAAAHPEITATVAISLPDSSTVLPDRPARLLLLVGGLEFPAFRDEAARAAGPGGGDRSMVVVPAVEHITVLYAPRTHRETADWLDESFGRSPTDRPMPSPLRRVGGAAILLLALAAGLYPVARLLFGRPRAGWPRPSPPELGVTAGVAAAAGAIAAIPPRPLPLGGYLVAFTAIAGVLLLGYRLWRGATFPAPPAAFPPGRLRPVLAAPVLIGYAAVAIAVPLQLGVTHVIPAGSRWWLLALTWAGFAVLGYAAERLCAGNSFGVLTVSAVAVIALTAAAVVGLASGFLLLIVPLLAVLLLWQAIWSAVLHRFLVPSWLIAPVGALVVAWPVAAALPLVG